MTIKECIEKIENDLFVANDFGLTEEQRIEFEFIFERLNDLEKAEKTLDEIELVIARMNDLI